MRFHAVDRSGGGPLGSWRGVSRGRLHAAPWRARLHARPLHRLPLVLSILILSVTPAPGAAYYLRPGHVERVSVASDGQQSVDPDFSPIGFSSWDTAINYSGRFVAFESSAINLVPGDVNGVEDIFVRDRKDHVTEIVSVATNGALARTALGACLPGTRNPGPGSFDPSISANGRWVAFTSCATNLVPGDTNLHADVFVHDRATGVTERVSVSSEGRQGNGPSLLGGISPDGRYVAFSSYADNLVAEDGNDRGDTFIHDRRSGTTELVSLSSEGEQGNNDSGCGSVSRGGRYVAFSSYATNFHSDDDLLMADAFVHDRKTRKTEHLADPVRPVVFGTGGGTSACGNGGSTISANGRFVLLTSVDANLVPADTNGSFDVFVFDRKTGRTERVSVYSDGSQGEGTSGTGALSADGRYVALWSNSRFFDQDSGDAATGNTVPPSTSGDPDVFIYDRETKAVEWISVNDAGDEATGCRSGTGSDFGDSKFPAVSSSGRFVAFESCATNLVPEDSNLAPDIFVRDRGDVIGVGDLIPKGRSQKVQLPPARNKAYVLDLVQDHDRSGAKRIEAADLQAVRLIYRPMLDDMMVLFELADLSAHVPQPIVYSLSFQMAGVRWELRAASAAATRTGGPAFGLFRCDRLGACVEVRYLRGSYGSIGQAVTIVAPLGPLGLRRGGEIFAPQARAGLGIYELGIDRALDRFLATAGDRRANTEHGLAAGWLR